MHKVRITETEAQDTSHRSEVMRNILEGVKDVSSTKMLQIVCKAGEESYTLKTVSKDLYIWFGKITQPGLQALCEFVRTECEEENIFEVVVEIDKVGLHFSMNCVGPRDFVLFVSKH